MKYILRIFGITREPKSKDLMLVLFPMQENLWKFTEPTFQYKWHEVYVALHIIAAGIEGIHKLDILHRDLHPGNILIDQGEYRLADFGLSGPPNLTQGERYGILPFIAPEVINGKEYTPAADVYSFGMLMYVLAASAPPFKDREHDCGLALDIFRGLR